MSWFIETWVVFTLRSVPPSGRAVRSGFKCFLSYGSRKTFIFRFHDELTTESHRWFRETKLKRKRHIIFLLCKHTRVKSLQVWIRRRVSRIYWFISFWYSHCFLRGFISDTGGEKNVRGRWKSQIVTIRERTGQNLHRKYSSAAITLHKVKRKNWTLRSFL